ncbi:hypothetical protein M9458_041272, partial [Cirrhinus mrigala]
PSQNPVGVYPSNQGFMAPPQPGYVNNLPTKGPPPPAGPSLYGRHQPSPVGAPGALPASPNHMSGPSGPPQGSATPPPANSYYQHPRQPGWSGVTPPPPAGNNASPVPPAMYRGGTGTPPVFQNAMQPPAPSVNNAAMTGTSLALTDTTGQKPGIMKIC